MSTSSGEGAIRASMKLWKDWDWEEGGGRRRREEDTEEVGGGGKRRRSVSEREGMQKPYCRKHLSMILGIKKGKNSFLHLLPLILLLPCKTPLEKVPSRQDGRQ